MPAAYLHTDDFLTAISARAGRKVTAVQPVGGGSINITMRLLLADGGSLFCKRNSAPNFPQLMSAEAHGLRLLSNTQLIRTPAVVDQWEERDFQYLLLEWIDEGTPTDRFWEDFGRQLAALHQCSAAMHGSVPDNYMGSVPQSNRTHADWSTFFLEERLLPVARLCEQKGLLGTDQIKSISELGRNLVSIFGNPAPALLHGDLWSGNFLCAANGDPVLIDPAVYYGHPAMDLGMTTLFGGFEPAFYAAYNEAAPLPANHREQWEVANLYPLLIHLYLFGRSYHAAIEETLHRFR
jgi:protein-ribulosamine 3-kinase